MASPKRKRLDILLVERNLFANRTLARTAIMDGGILIAGIKATKPGELVRADSEIEIRPGWESPKYASRGGLKLEKALDIFHIKPAGRICLDIGASTGGFTDCLLQRNASTVHAIDVGYGQLDWKLRQDPRVCVHERVNARYLSLEKLYRDSEKLANLAVIDVSFISIVKILPACISLLEKSFFEIVCLVKPQFEAPRNHIGKGGIVRNKSTHIEVLTNFGEQVSKLGLTMLGLTHSPITGASGNIEFLAHLSNASCNSSADIHEIVNTAHLNLSKLKS